MVRLFVEYFNFSFLIVANNKNYIGTKEGKSHPTLKDGGNFGGKIVLFHWAEVWRNLEPPNDPRRRRRPREWCWGRRMSFEVVEACCALNRILRFDEQTVIRYRSRKDRPDLER